jgi:iron complex transport system permease protein
MSTFREGGIVAKVSFFVLLASPLLALVICLFAGTYRVPIADVLKITFFKLLQPIFKALSALTFGFVNAKAEVSCPEVYRVILLKIRLPRVLMAMVVGSALSVSGVCLQAIFRNPLVDSYILGISAGAAFGASVALMVPKSVSIAPLAFAFSMVAVFLTVTLARASGKTSPVALVLAGIIVNAFFSALTSLVKFVVEREKLAGIVYWLMGSFANTDMGSVKVAAPLILLGCFLIYLMRWHLNVLSFGEESKLLGKDPEKLKIAFTALVSLITAVSVAFCGIIGWVGLIVPHTLRMAFGPDNRNLVPLALSVGATFTALADTLARTLTTFEIPIGILTTLLGIPFFAYLLWKTGGGWHA